MTEATDILAPTLDEQKLKRALSLPIRDVERIPKMLVATEAQLEAIKTEGFDVKRLSALAVMACNKTPALLKATGSSLLLACLDAARCGIEPDGTHGAIVPYGDEAQFQPMYRGLLRVATMGGGITKAYADTIHEADEFTRWNEDGVQHCRHVPPPLGTKRGEMIGALAVVTLASGERLIDVMDDCLLYTSPSPRD